MKFLKAISSLLLATLVTLSSMGFYVDHMVCGMSGEHKLAINQTIDSCGDSCDRGSEDTVERSCCDYNSNYFQEDLPANPSQQTEKQQYSSFRYVSVSELFEPVNYAENCCFALVNKPDILPSVERHILLQTYLI